MRRPPLVAAAAADYSVAFEHLVAVDRDACVPCSRYGYDTESCAKIAAAVATIVARATDEDLFEIAESIMGLVVNDHDDPERLLREHGATYGFNPADFLER